MQQLYQQFLPEQTQQWQMLLLLLKPQLQVHHQLPLMLVQVSHLLASRLMKLLFKIF
jgi:hypothetical protein